MNEQEVMEVIQLRTLTHEGKQTLMSVPITQHVTRDIKVRLEKQTRIAIKCTKLSNQVLAVIEEPVFFENRREEICARLFGTI